MAVTQPDFRSTARAYTATAFSYLYPGRSDSKRDLSRILIRRDAVAMRCRAALNHGVLTLGKKKVRSSICTADELHYVSVANSDWRLALWRYLPSSLAPQRNHPLLLLSGVGTNAVGYDLSPESSFARYMSGQGFDTWILEVRGAGLSTNQVEFRNVKLPISQMPERISSGVSYEKAGSKTSLREIILSISKRLSSFLNEGGDNPSIANRINQLTQRLINIIEDAQHSPPMSFFDLQDRFSMTLEDFQKQLDETVKYDWDFDHYLEEDLPAAMEYIRNQCRPKDGKLLAIGHSMGGILLYAMLARCNSMGVNSKLASVATLASSLDYSSSKSSLRLLLPLKDPARALKVPVIPLGTLLAAAHPLASLPPYLFSWLNLQITAKDMMSPDLLEKLVMNNFGTVPAKLLLQLSTAFKEGGLCDRSGSFYYKDHLHKTKVPVLALAGDHDLICPPEAVSETVKLIPKHLATYRVLGKPNGPHYAHYDLVGGLLAAEQVYPLIVNFLNRHDIV